MLVEYVQGQIYFGLVEEEELIYCRKPMGQIKENEFWDNTSLSSFCLNMQDRQSFNRDYIILQMKGDIRNKAIDKNSLSFTPEAQATAITKYIQSKVQH